MRYSTAIDPCWFRWSIVSTTTVQACLAVGKSTFSLLKVTKGLVLDKTGKAG